MANGMIMATGRLLKWLHRDETIRIYIMDAYEIIVKENRKTKRGQYRFEFTAVIKRHGDQLTIWFPIDEDNGWMSKPVNDAAHIRSQYQIPLSDDALELYDAMLMARKLIK